jgi:plasmid stabilization system protein ParE
VKRYEVVFLPEARLEALAAAEYIARHSPGNAIRWYRGLEKAIRRLEMMPRRCTIAPESTYLDVELRHYIYKSHRVIFQVDDTERVVRILHVRHCAQRAIGESELDAK